jgi:hypothetical protein
VGPVESRDGGNAVLCLLHCCYAVVTLLSALFGTVVTLRVTLFVTLLLHCCYTVVIMVVTRITDSGTCLMERCESCYALRCLVHCCYAVAFFCIKRLFAVCCTSLPSMSYAAVALMLHCGHAVGYAVCCASRHIR